MTNRLMAVGRINRMTGEVQKLGVKSHWELREQLGDPSPEKNYDQHVEGFIDSEGNFLTRREAVAVGIAAGQLTADWATVRRELLSSDINWDAGFKDQMQYGKRDDPKWQTARDATPRPSHHAESRQVRRARERKDG